MGCVDWAEWDDLVFEWNRQRQRGVISDLEHWQAMSRLGVDHKPSPAFAGVWVMDGYLVTPAHWIMSPDGREIKRID